MATGSVLWLLEESGIGKGGLSVKKQFRAPKQSCSPRGYSSCANAGGGRLRDV